jgi:curved DNA-binding protein CbpA
MKIQEIEASFRSLESLEEAKALYKTLAKELHPDRGGNSEDFKALSNIYHKFVDNYGDKEKNISIELEKKISEIIYFDNIYIELVGEWIWVSGDTKPIKDKLKESGFKWAKNKEMWYFGESRHRTVKPQSMDEIRAKYGSIKKSREKRDRKYIDIGR